MSRLLQKKYLFSAAIHIFFILSGVFFTEYVPKIVTKVENCRLNTLCTELEVKATVFILSGYISNRPDGFT